MIALCLAYVNRLAAGKEPPSSLADLGDFLAQEKPRITNFFSGNRFTIVWGISAKSIQVNIFQLMAYETQPEKKRCQEPLLTGGKKVSGSF